MSENAMTEKPNTESLSGDMAAVAAPAVHPAHPLSGWRGFIRRNRNAVGALLMFLFFWGILIFFSGGVFQNPAAYTSIFTTLPLTVLLVVAVIFTTTNGAIDLSYTSTIGIGAFLFAWFTMKAANPANTEPWLISPEMGPWVGLLAALAGGVFVGLFNSLLVLRFRLTPFIATLGVQFFMRGLLVILSDAKSMPVPYIEKLGFYNVCCGAVFGPFAAGLADQFPDSGFFQFVGPLIAKFPNQMLWAVLFFAITWLLYSKHTVGRHTRIIGDNEESSREMGIPINRVKAFSYIYTGVAASLAGVMFIGTYFTFWPETGSVYLLPVLTAVFVGGNPLVGGMGTVAGAFIGSMTVAFIETGIIAMGFVDVYTQFVYGIVLIISLLGFRSSRR
ncbi:MAG: ABC transporter permease [Anaerolineae bacterium]|nr:ABC transporter permease [Anaerolineae bacterium]